jgi:uncharacterized membrane protein YfcA
MDLSTLAIAAAALALGGIVKGATGAGAPVVAVPVLAMLYDVPFAVAVFTMPNFLSNIWQAWSLRAHQRDPRFTAAFAISGAAGAGVGSVLLANLPSEALTLTVAGAVFLYLAFRLAAPDWSLSFARARPLAPVAGFAGGVLQGAAGVSAPISISFLNAIRLPKPEFIATISVFFMAMSAVQIPLLAYLGILTWERAGIGLVSTAFLLAAMPLGARLTRHVSPKGFDRIIMGLLGAMAMVLVARALV